MGLLSWILFGLAAGALTRLVVPGDRGRGILMTIGLGIGGAVLGGLVAAAAGWGGLERFDVRSLLIAVGGGVVILVAYRLIVGGGRGD